MKAFTENESIRMFALGCVTTRTIMSCLPLVLPSHWLRFYGILIALISLGFLYLFFAGKRLKAPEGGAKTWWAGYRLIHGALWGCAAVYLFKGERRAALPLALDTLLGIGLFVNHRLTDCST